jgi:hypothetical protein
MAEQADGLGAEMGNESDIQDDLDEYGMEDSVDEKPKAKKAKKQKKIVVSEDESDQMEPALQEAEEDVKRT